MARERVYLGLEEEEGDISAEVALKLLVLFQPREQSGVAEAQFSQD